MQQSTPVSNACSTHAASRNSDYRRQWYLTASTTEWRYRCGNRCCKEKSSQTHWWRRFQDGNWWGDTKRSNCEEVLCDCEWVFSKYFDTIRSMVERLMGVAPSIQRSDPNSYTDTPYIDEMAFVEMPRKFSFPNMMMYDGTNDPDNPIQATNAHCNSPKGAKESYHVQGFQINLDRTWVTMVH